jgi:uncharacterized membrane protein
MAQRDETPAGSDRVVAQDRAARPPRFRYGLPGAWVALVFACLAFTPSLLPRSALL